MIDKLGETYYNINMVSELFEKGENMFKDVTRGSIFMADLPIKKGSSVQGGLRPVLVVQNDRRKHLRSNVTSNSAHFTL